MTRRNAFSIAAAIALLLPALPARAQSLGSLYWRLAPYCNVVALHVTQENTPTGPVFRLTGMDDRCGAIERSPLVGTAAPNADGSLTVAFTTISAAGAPSHVNARLTGSSLSGPWTDSAGNGGTMSPFAGATSGSARPVGGASSPGSGAATWGTVTISVDGAPTLTARSPNVTSVSLLNLDGSIHYCVTFSDAIPLARRRAAVIGPAGGSVVPNRRFGNATPLFARGDDEVCVGGLGVAEIRLGLSMDDPQAREFTFIVP